MKWATRALDAAAVTAFVLIGRASHHHGETVSGFFSTVWPFAVGMLAGWVVTRRRPPATVATGAVVAVVTVALGMLLRVVSGAGTAVAFVVVALCFLGLVMVGGRPLLARRPGRAALR